MNIIQIASVVAASVIAVMVIKKTSPDMALLLSVGSSVVIAMLFVSDLAQLIETTMDRVSVSVNEEYFTVPVKALGMVLISSFTKAICEEAGEKSMAFTVGIAGKTAVAMAAFPLFEGLLDMIGTMLGVI